MAAGTGAPVWAVFAAMSAALALSAFAGPAVGRWIDRAGGRAALCGANLAIAAGLVALAAAQGPALLLLGWACLGAGMALGLYEAAFATLARIFGAGARGPITGVTLIAGFASTLAWPLTAWLEVETGWRGACLAWAAAQIAVGLPLHLSLPRGTAASRPAAAPAPETRAPAWSQTALLAGAFCATWIVATGVAAHLPRLLEAGGAAPAAAVAAAALLGPAQVAARLADWALLRRAHPLWAARLATLAHPAGAAALGLWGGGAAAGFAAAHGAGAGVLTVAKGALPLALFGPAGYGGRLGAIMAPARVGQALAPLLFALLIDAHGAGALWVSAALSLLAGAAFLALPARQ